VLIRAFGFPAGVVIAISKYFVPADATGPLR